MTGFRPVFGGITTDFTNLGGGPCTLGFVANFGSGHGFVTAGHCGGLGWVHGTQFYQNTIVGMNHIGEEVNDPLPFDHSQDPNCPPGATCRWSDAVYVLFNNSNLGDLGHIAKPLFNSIVLVDGFTIIDERAFPDSADTVHKVGRETGWTDGVVVNTCVNDGDTSEPGLILLCQDYFKGDVQLIGGDSGAPVFKIISGNDIQLYGVLWGRDVSDFTLGKFSAMGNIEYELGFLTTH